MSESALRRWSEGIVIKDKVEGSDIIDVTPMEKLPESHGNLDKPDQVVKSSTVDAQGVNRDNSATKGTGIKATWLPNGDGNRNTAPDVCAGETVQIYRVGDSNVYFWTTLYREPKIRRLETVCWMFGNLSKKLVEWTKATSYWFEVSTKRKHVWLHTSNSDGEKFGYDIKLDTKSGVLTITDNANMTIVMDSSKNEYLFKGGKAVFDCEVEFKKKVVHKEEVKHEKKVGLGGGGQSDGDLTVKGNFSALGGCSGCR